MISFTVTDMILVIDVDIAIDTVIVIIGPQRIQPRSDTRPSAAERLAALRARVLAKARL